MKDWIRCPECNKKLTPTHETPNCIFWHCLDCDIKVYKNTEWIK